MKFQAEIALLLALILVFHDELGISMKSRSVALEFT